MNLISLGESQELLRGSMNLISLGESPEWRLQKNKDG